MRMREAEKIFSKTLIDWHLAHGRHDLPWQVDAWYPRLVSEVMLQQTQVVTVLPKYQAFMTAFPTPDALAQATDDEVMALWAGLGYYSRARNLVRAVRTIVYEKDGQCPRSAAELERLPGLGPSTAGAIAAFTFGERAVMADGNAQRVLSRVFLIEGHAGQTAFVKKIRTLAQALLPESEWMSTYTQALMDFGALLCTRTPNCTDCPLSAVCGARQMDRVRDFPGKKPKKERPVRYAEMVFAFQGEQLWLRRKVERGVWHGLWVPPMLEGDAPITALDISALLRVRQEEVRRVIRLQAMVHDFTHYRLIIHPVAIDLEQMVRVEGYQLFNDRTPGVGLPAPVDKLLKVCLEERDLRPTLW